MMFCTPVQLPNLRRNCFLSVHRQKKKDLDCADSFFHIGKRVFDMKIPDRRQKNKLQERERMRWHISLCDSTVWPVFADFYSSSSADHNNICKLCRSWWGGSEWASHQGKHFLSFWFEFWLRLLFRTTVLTRYGRVHFRSTGMKGYPDMFSSLLCFVSHDTSLWLIRYSFCKIIKDVTIKRATITKYGLSDAPKKVMRNKNDKTQRHIPPRPTVTPDNRS